MKSNHLTAYLKLRTSPDTVTKTIWLLYQDFTVLFLGFN